MKPIRLNGNGDAADLAILGYDPSPDEDGPTACIRGPARRLARLVIHASRELDAVVTHAEWNAIADCMNGCADLYDYADSDVPPLLMVVANLQDSPGIGAKWAIDVRDLCQRLVALSPVHGEAILAAVRWFWRNCDSVNSSNAGWWRPDYRLTKQEGE